MNCPNGSIEVFRNEIIDEKEKAIDKHIPLSMWHFAAYVLNLSIKSISIWAEFEHSVFDRSQLTKRNKPNSVVTKDLKE